MLAGSKLETVLSELKTGEMLEGLELKNALSGSILGDTLSGSTTEQKLAISRLGESLATSKLAEILVGRETVEALTASDLARQISETLETDLLATNIRDSVGKDPEFNSKRLESGVEDQLRLSVGKILTELPLEVTLKGSKLGYILKSSGTEPILLSSTGIRAGHSVLVNTPLETDYVTPVPVHPMLDRITPAPVMTDFGVEHNTPVITYVLPGYDTPVVDPVIPILTTIGTVFLKLLAPIVTFLFRVPSNINQLLGGVLQYISEYTTPMVKPTITDLKRIGTAFLEKTALIANPITLIVTRVLPALKQIVTLVKKPIAPAVALFSDLHFYHQSLEIPFISTKLWVFESFILFFLSVFGAYYFIYHYLFAWTKLIDDAPLPPEGTPPPAGSPPFAAKHLDLPGATSEWSGTSDSPSPLSQISKLPTYTHRSLAYLLLPFTYIHRLLSNLGIYCVSRLLNLLIFIHDSITYIDRSFKYMLWLLSGFEHHLFPWPPLINPPLSILVTCFVIKLGILFCVFLALEAIIYCMQRFRRITQLLQTLRKTFENISYTNNRHFTSRVSSRQHRFPGFSQGRHRHLSHPQWYPLFHVVIGIIICYFGYCHIPIHPDA